MVNSMVCELFLSRTITNKTKHKHTCLVHCIPSVPSLPLQNDPPVACFWPPWGAQIWKEGPVERSFTYLLHGGAPRQQSGRCQTGHRGCSWAAGKSLLLSVDTLQLLQQGGICPLEERGCPMGRGPTAQPLGTQVSGAPQRTSNWVQND